VVAIDTVNELPLVVAAIEPEVGEILISHAVVSVYIWSDHSLDWINKGVGVVKLSQISEQMHRIVMRVHKTFRLVLNMLLYRGMKIFLQNEKFLVFFGSENGVMKKILLKFKSSSDALKFHDSVNINVPLHSSCNKVATKPIYLAENVVDNQDMLASGSSSSYRFVSSSHIITPVVQAPSSSTADSFSILTAPPDFKSGGFAAYTNIENPWLPKLAAVFPVSTTPLVIASAFGENSTSEVEAPNSSSTTPIIDKVTDEALNSMSITASLSEKEMDDTRVADVVATSSKRKRDDDMDELYESMKRMNTNDEGTKRFLIALHYINHHCGSREVRINGKSGDITFARNS
jgi:hypothetical protein